MKKAIALFLVSVLVFIGAWIIKPKTPVVRPDSYRNGLTNQGNWWVTTVSADEVSSVWKLDPEIPDNYLPVPGEDELYMVIDNSTGTILKYRHRVKQENGSWLWEDVNPDIPDNYEAVEGLENVYKVTFSDGTVKYYRYIRNKDNDTFAFVEVDEHGNDIEIVTPKGSEIPDNYAHMGENVYAVLNQYGVVVGYKQRIQNDDGSYSWIDVTKPDVSRQDILNGDYSGWLTGVDGVTDLSKIGGGLEGVTLVPQVVGELSEDDLLNLPEINVDIPDVNPPSGWDSQGGGTAPGLPYGYPSQDPIDTSMLQQGYSIDKRYIYTTEKNGSYLVTFVTEIDMIYTSDGELFSSIRKDPVEVERKPITTTSGQTLNHDDIVTSSLDAEVSRISYGVTFSDGMENAVLANFNAERAQRGYAPLSMDRGGSAYKLAKARAAALSITDSADYINPLYGDLPNMMSMYRIEGDPSEATWRTSADKDAIAIYGKFMSQEGANEAILSPFNTQVGIAIAEANGNFYICIVFL